MVGGAEKQKTNLTQNFACNLVNADQIIAGPRRQVNAQQCVTTRENGFLTGGGQGIFKGLLAELHICIFAWLTAAEKLVMERFAPHESLGDYTSSDCPIPGTSKLKEVRANFLEDLFQVQHCLQMHLWILSIGPPLS